MKREELIYRLRLPAAFARISAVLALLSVFILGAIDAIYWLGVLPAALWWLLGRGLSQGKEWARKIGNAVFFLLLLSVLKVLIFTFFGRRLLMSIMADMNTFAPPVQVPLGNETDAPRLFLGLLGAGAVLALSLPFRRCCDPRLREPGVLNAEGNRLAHLTDAGVFILCYACQYLLEVVMTLLQLLRFPAEPAIWLFVFSAFAGNVAAVRLLWQGKGSGMIATWVTMALMALVRWLEGRAALAGGETSSHAISQFLTLDTLVMLLLFSVIFFQLSKQGLLASVGPDEERAGE